MPRPSFSVPSFSTAGLAWPSDEHMIPISADDLVAFADWVSPQLNQLIGDRVIIMIKIDESLHDRQMEILSRILNIGDATIQIVGRTPARIAGWSGSTRSEGESLLLPFHVTGTQAAFFWIDRIEKSDGTRTTGLHIRYANRHSERDDLTECDVSITLADWCKTTGHEPDPSS